MTSYRYATLVSDQLAGKTGWGTAVVARDERDPPNNLLGNARLDVALLVIQFDK